MTYEMLYIVPAPYTEKDVDSIAKETNKIIEELGGKIIQEKKLGARVLAYPIKKVKQGFYVLLYFTLPASQVKSLSQSLKLREDILRFLIIKKQEGKVKKQKPRREKISSTPQPSSPEKPKIKKQKKKKLDLSKIDQEIDELLDLK